MRRRTGPGIAACVALTALFLIVWGWASGAEEQVTERVSVSSAGAEGSLESQLAATSADGRYVAFSSDAPDLVFNDINARDVFVRDRVMSTTELVSVASNEMQANRSALFPAISADGRYVVFASEADNLAPNDTNDKSDIFIRDRQLGTTERLSVDSSGAQASDDSLTPSISGDGRYVTFTSRAEDLVPDDANGTFDAFVHDRDTGVTELVSVASDGTHGNFASGGAGAGPARISSDGRYAVFGSFASNLVGDDGNGVDDVFVRDRQLGITDRVSIATGGTEGNSHSIYGSVSDDGRYAVFESTADTLTPDDDNQASDVFLRDRQLATTVRLSDASDTEQGNGASHFAAISADGEAVAFQSDAFNLVSGDGNGTTDVFRLERGSGVIDRMSVTSGGAEAHGASTLPAISAQGEALAFQSTAPDLVSNDGNGAADIFVRGKSLAPPTPTPTITPPITPTPTAPPVASGDVNCDGNVNSLDAALVLQFVAGVIDTLPCFEAADVNEDGLVNAVDAALILQFDAGIIPELPP